MARAFLLLSLCLAISARAEQSNEMAQKLGEAIILHASFDKGLDADRAVGDPVLYTAPEGDRTKAVAGLPVDNLVVHAKGEGKFGDALHFTKKMKPVVHFKGPENIGY